MGKKVLIICMLLFRFVAINIATPNITSFTVMRFIAAIGMGALMPNLISMMTEYSPLKSRAMVVAAMYCGYSLGGVMASLTGMYIIPITDDWRVLYYIGALPLLTLPFFIKQFPESLSYYMSRKNTGKIAEIV